MLKNTPSNPFIVSSMERKELIQYTAYSFENRLESDSKGHIAHTHIKGHSEGVGGPLLTCKG